MIEMERRSLMLGRKSGVEDGGEGRRKRSWAERGQGAWNALESPALVLSLLMERVVAIQLARDELPIYP